MKEGCKSLDFLRVINPRTAADDDEIVGVGDDLSPGTLLWAYRHGIFPWPMEGLPLLWFCPPERAVLDFVRLHVSTRLARLRKASGFAFTIDRAFSQVITCCRDMNRPGQDDTWITEEMAAAYTRLHALGFAHSVEAWDEAGALVGGLYGVAVGGVFSGESMFHRAPNASKFALLFLIDHLRGRGADWIDIQVMTPHFAALGASLIPRSEFLDRLEVAQSQGLKLFD